MSARDAEYIRQSEYCRKMAEQAGTDDSKVAWLTLANKWLALTDNRPEIAHTGLFDGIGPLAIADRSETTS